MFSIIRAMDSYQIKIEENTFIEDIQALRRNLSEFNFTQTAQRGQHITVFIRDGEAQIVGGCDGWTAYGWLHIDVIWLRENLRGKGLGRQVLEAAETESKR